MIETKIEEFLQKAIFPDLEKGRPGWDLPHTRSVVHWAKNLTQDDLKYHKIVVTAAYAHDWGYMGLFSQHTPTYDQIQEFKLRHMVLGAEKITQLLAGSADFTRKEISRISHLVAVHDHLDILKADDEIYLMEADTLGALDTDFIVPTFNLQDNQKYLEEVKSKRFSEFRHERAKKAFDQLIEKRKDFYLNQKITN